MSSLLKLFKKFPTEQDCIKHLENIRWKNGVVCPYCKSTKTSKHLHRQQCQACHKSFSVTVGTIFHHTHLDLRNWFYILSLMINAKKGLSACQVARDLDMRRTTAWEVMHKIRKAFATEQKELLKGIFEMDETYIKTSKNNTKNEDDEDDNSGFGDFGDEIPFDKVGTGADTTNTNAMVISNFGDGTQTVRDRYACGRSTKNNTPIVGIKQKNGEIKVFATEDTKYHTLGKIAMSVAEVGSEIHTDEYASYKQFKTFYTHKTVNHSVEYVNADGIHCNGVESFWSLLKRGIKGQFHHISKKYLQRYIDEFEFRFNNRFVGEAVVFDSVVEKLLGIA